jgi:radical SAM protein with 4Fe4S-binding SPASM domain
MCGHQNPKINTTLGNGEIPLDLLQRIADQLPSPIVVAFHRNGEPTAYSQLSKALDMFSNQITSIVTHGLNLARKADEIIGRCTSVTVSIFHNDRDSEAQIESVREFLRVKGDRPPMVQLKLVGPGDQAPYEVLGVPIINRILHVPHGDTRYIKRDPTIPESRICMAFLGRPSVDWDGSLYICNLLDPQKHGYLGNLTRDSLDSLWNGEQRMEWLAAHTKGRRDLASPLCHDCKSYGVPTG